MTNEPTGANKRDVLEMQVLVSHEKREEDQPVEAGKVELREGAVRSDYGNKSFGQSVE